MKIPLYIIDAFAENAFGGNPAAVCILDQWIADDVLQNIAAENNLSETAFLVAGEPGTYKLRWFTPLIEVDLCGHATLASAYVIFSHVDPALETVRFETASGELVVNRDGDLLAMDFPAWLPEEIEAPDNLTKALGSPPVSVLKSRDLLVVYDNETQIRDMVPDFAEVERIGDFLGIIVTAPGDHCDFVSRFFAPRAGIPEDPVTGSAHCTLVPYWSARLEKKTMHAFQISRRRGELFCEHLGERVRIAGRAVLYAEGEVTI